MHDTERRVHLVPGIDERLVVGEGGTVYAQCLFNLLQRVSTTESNDANAAACCALADGRGLEAPPYWGSSN